jgi:hypothetical protein
MLTGFPFGGWGVDMRAMLKIYKQNLNLDKLFSSHAGAVNWPVCIFYSIKAYIYHRSLAKGEVLSLYQRWAVYKLRKSQIANR